MITRPRDPSSRRARRANVLAVRGWNASSGEGVRRLRMIDRASLLLVIAASACGGTAIERASVRTGVAQNDTRTRTIDRNSQPIEQRRRALPNLGDGSRIRGETCWI